MKPGQEFQTFRANVGQAIGLSGFDGSISAYRELTPSEQVRLTNKMAEHIRQNPTEFTPQQQAIARGINLPDVVDYPAGQKIADFFGAMVDELADINESVNPLSSSNRNWVLAIAAIGVFLYFVGPSLIQSIRQPK